LLEIGSGPGSDWKILSEFYNVFGSDYSSEFLNHLISENPKGEFLELDAMTLNTYKKFDGIYSNKVLHHLEDFALIYLVKRQYKILNPKGIICHYFWKGQGSKIFKGLFVNYHDSVSLIEIFDEYFDILSIEIFKEFEDEDLLLIIGRRK
jgi:hypothetical protein